MRYTHRILWVLLLSLACSQGVSGQTAGGTVMPSPLFYGTDSNGNPLSAGKLCVYVAGTSTLAATYNDVDLAAIHQNANPVVLDSSGHAVVFLSPGASYKFVLRSAGVSSVECTTGTIQWTRDNVSSTPSSSSNYDINGLAGEAIAMGNAVYLSDGAGGKIGGQWYKADSGQTYSSTTAVLVGFAPAAIASGAIGSIRLGGEVTGLVTAAGTTYFISTSGALTTTAPANRRQIAFGNSSTSVLIAVDPASIATDGSVKGPLKGYHEIYQIGSISAGVVTVDYSLGNHIIITLNANITSFTVTNLPSPTTGVVAPLVVYFVMDGTPRTVTHTINAVAARFPSAVAPTLTSTAGKLDSIVYLDINGVWYATLMAQNQ